MVLGRCWRPLIGSVGFSPLDGSRVALVGAREISPPAHQRLQHCGVVLVAPEQEHAGVCDAIEQLRRAGVKRIHIHVDLDVLDPDLVGPANSYALSGGLSTAQLLAALDSATNAFELATASVASYDPKVGRSGSIAAAGVKVVTLLAKARSAG